ncbi:MocR-like transcription factor YczR [Castellaniella caeni]|uniref:MocR-like transcription factor YczR n=1 Tax=Castellaniella caeni TaxID=266123 RepID=UPI000C9F2178|nr:PLP-dependent aminotransferase family protein [Castellaniella caeni]
MKESITARQLSTLVGTLPAGTAYVGLADQLTLLIGDGRIPLGVRLPSERSLAAALGRSRTTITRAYLALRDSGYARATQGSGTYTAVPGGRRQAHDRVLVAGGAGEDWIDLSCAADSAPAEVMAAYTAALSDLPTYLSGHGYFPSGLRVLQEAVAAAYQVRGLPTVPEQIIVTPGALSAASIVVRALASRRGHALIESPTYPNAAETLRAAGLTLHETPLGLTGWDMAGMMHTIQQARPDFAYLVPDFQNPTGAVMTTDQRQQLGRCLQAHGVAPIVDETHQALALDGQAMPAPFACFNPDTITLGSLSKAFWGGLRVGWIRAPQPLLGSLTRARMSLDLGVPIVEQLAAAHLLRQGTVSPGQIQRLRAQRDALMQAVATHLPDWRFVPPAGGLALWCELPCRGATALAAAMTVKQVAITPGPVFSPDGGLDAFIRLPWSRPVADLRQAVDRIALAWRSIATHALDLPASRQHKPIRLVMA